MKSTVLSDTQKRVLRLACSPNGFAFNGWDARTVQSLRVRGLVTVRQVPAPDWDIATATDAGREAIR